MCHAPDECRCGKCAQVHRLPLFACTECAHKRCFKCLTLRLNRGSEECSLRSEMRHDKHARYVSCVTALIRHNSVQEQSQHGSKRSLDLRWVSSWHDEKQCIWWCAACSCQYDWWNPNRILVMQDSTDRREAKAFRAHAAPHGVCDNLINALKLLANQHQDSDSPVRVLVQVREGSDELTLEEDRYVAHLHRLHECGRQYMAATARG